MPELWLRPAGSWDWAAASGAGRSASAGGPAGGPSSEGACCSPEARSVPGSAVAGWTTACSMPVMGAAGDSVIPFSVGTGACAGWAASAGEALAGGTLGRGFAGLEAPEPECNLSLACREGSGAAVSGEAPSALVPAQPSSSRHLGSLKASRITSWCCYRRDGSSSFPQRQCRPIVDGNACQQLGKRDCEAAAAGTGPAADWRAREVWQEPGGGVPHAAGQA